MKAVEDELKETKVALQTCKQVRVFIVSSFLYAGKAKFEHFASKCFRPVGENANLRQYVLVSSRLGH